MIDTEYIKHYMKEIQEHLNEALPLTEGITKRELLRSSVRKAQFVINYIENQERRHDMELVELEQDMNIFRDSNV